MRTTDTVTTALSVDELAASCGVPVRTIRFYTGKKLLPPPRLEGRTGRYDDRHLARLELIRDLTDHGYTLSAVESFLERLPLDADADEIAMFGALVAPWTPDSTTMSTAALATALGRTPTDLDLAILGVDADADGPHRVSAAAIGLLRELGSSDIPEEMFRASGLLLHQHVTALADELQEVFRQTVLRPYHDGPRTPADRERVRAVAAQLREVTSRSLVVAFQRAIDQLIRDSLQGDDRTD